MPTLLVGKTKLAGKTKLGPAAGVTLIEMMVVVGLIALIVGISFPALTSGIDSMRLHQATASVVAFFNTGLSRAERRQQVVEISISKAQNNLEMRSTEAGFTHNLALPDGISITHIYPDLPETTDGQRTFLLYPGATVPRFGVALINRRNVERIVRMDPITGVPQVEKPTQ